MDPNRWAVLDAALEQRLDGRPVDLDHLTSGERELLNRLVAAAGQASEALDTPAVLHEALVETLEAELSLSGEASIGERVGPFRLVRRIAAGGMGVVFEAERAEGFEQRVALKLMAHSHVDPSSIRLFERERELLAQLEHPNIARLIDGGVTDQGRPWFAMEYIDGEPLIGHADARSLTVPLRLALFLEACDALEYAHRQLILHRDVKPANLLVDRDGRVKLVDFGLGRTLTPDAPDVQETLARGRMTPAWASPEQARGEPVTPRSEVYQLGLVLYRLLTGQSPYEVEDSSTWTVIQAVTTGRIARPSEAWRGDEARAEAAERLGTPASKLRRRLGGDLDNIVLKALSRDPARRYAGVDALAEDLRRHVRREPVQARAATRRYRLGRFLQRHRIAVAGATAFGLLLVTSVVVFALQSLALQVERDRAVSEAARNDRVVDAMAGMIRLSHSDQRVEQLYSRGELLDQYVEHVRRELAADPAIRARLLGILGDALHGLDRWGQARRVIADALDTLNTTGDADPEEILELQRLLADAHAFDGELSEAVALLDDLASRDDVESDPSLLAGIVFQRGFLRTYHTSEGSPAFSAGIADLEHALAIHSSLHSPPDERIARSMHALGFKTYRSDRGMQLMGDALDMTRTIHGERHANTAARLAEYALAHDLRGDPSRAADLAERAYRIHAELRGRTHPDTLSMLSNLASFYRAAGDLDQSISLYRELHALRARVLPGDHLLLAFTAHGLGNALRETGDHRASERWLREALRLCLAHDSPNEAITRENLARTLAADGQLDAAIEQQRAALDAYRRFMPGDERRLAAARERLDALRSGTGVDDA